MSPLRWDVLLTGFVLALPVVALGLRGDLTAEETMTRVLWCLGAGWAVVAVIRFAIGPGEATPPAPQKATSDATGKPLDPSGDAEPSPA
jgi:hypothetical protein